MVAADFVGAEEITAKLKMRAGLKSIKRPGSLAAKLGSLQGMDYLFSNTSNRGEFTDFDCCSLLSIAAGVLHGLEEGSKGAIPSKPGRAISVNVI